MKKTNFLINQIPAVLWGETSSNLFLAVHGNRSSKTDVPIVILAEEAAALGYQVLSFDLPEHGDRKEEGVPCNAQHCVADLKTVLAFTKPRFDSVSLMANSMGAYFSLLAYQNEVLRQAFFLSPVVDMEQVIQNMMKWCDISEQRLQAEQKIKTPTGQALYWDDYQYIKSSPITKWSVPTSILYGSRDEICVEETILAFARRFHCGVETAENSGHYFHTEKDLNRYRNWLRGNFAP